jgi:hypothetical protein
VQIRNGAIVFRERRLGCEGDRVKAARFDLSVWALTALGEGQEPKSTSCQTRSRG